MKEKANSKIIKTILSLIISFLIIFIIAMFARSITNSVFPSDSKVAVFVNDYLDMMMQKIDNIALKMRVKRNTVSEYQVNLITQSISDYVGYSMYQSSGMLSDYDPKNQPKGNALEKYKSDYYKMTLENPYLRGMTVFNTSGNMLLNLYLSGNKSWPLQLEPNLIAEIKNKGSLVLNATNENSFYIMEYFKNKYGEIIVATRNDYSYVSDIAMYYQVPDKSLYVSDSKNSIYNVQESANDIERVSSVINRYAYYKKQPSFVVNDTLSVSLVGKEYPNYFELIVLALTAFFIVVFQIIIRAVMNFFRYLLQVQKKHAESYPLPDDDIPMIDEDIIKSDIPKSSIFEENPPLIQKVFHKIPKENIEPENNEDIEKNILNLVSAVKEEIESYNNENYFVHSKDFTDNMQSDSLQNKNEESEKLESFENIKEDIIENIVKEKEENIEDNVVEDDIEAYDVQIAKESDSYKETESFLEDKHYYKKENYKKENKEYTYENISSEEKDRYAVRELKTGDILSSYDKAINNINEIKDEMKDIEVEKKENRSSRSDDVFEAFDKMLASIINKAETEARDIISKKG